MNLNFGTINKFGEKTDANGDNITAVIIPDDSAGAVTLELYIPVHLRKLFQNVQVGETVVYCTKNDGLGIILGLLPDYENDKTEDWDGIVRNNIALQFNGNVHIKGSLTIDGNLMTAGNSLTEGNSDILGNIAADGNATLGKGIEVTESGVNIGGTGTLIASLASLITFRMYVAHNKGGGGKYVLLYSAFSFAFLLILTVVSSIF